VNHLSISTYVPNFTEIEETFCGRTYVRTFETGFIKSILSKSRQKDLYYNVGLHISLAQKLKQVSKVIWQEAASPSCQASQRQMNLSDLDSDIKMVP